MSLLNVSQTPLIIGLGLLLSAFSVYVIRVLFAPLSRVPGPWHTKYTDIVLVYHNLTAKGPKYVHRLHQIYGPIVRISPYQVDVTDISAVKAIYDIKNEYPKSPWYLRFNDMSQHDVFSTPNVDVHRRHRRLLAGGMSESSLKSYLPTVTGRVDLAVARMREEMNKEGAVDIWKWWLFMTTDVIGELTFGESFKTLEQGKKSGYTRELHLSATLGIVRTTFPSILPLLSYLPIKTLKDAFETNIKMTHYAQESIARYQNLLASDPTRAQSTVFTKIFQAKEDNKMTPDEILNNARIFIIAGSDTTANTLTYLVWAVCRDARIKKKLMEEIDGLPEDYTDGQLKELTYMGQIIEETLRLHPVVPAGLPRIVPASGASLVGHWIPGGTTVSCQSQSMHRDGSVFTNPESFVPERWENPTKEMKTQFMAFGRGSRVCLGMHLAYMELRHGIVKFFREFPTAKMSSQYGMSDDDMDPLLGFLIAPKGQRCLIDEQKTG